LVQPTVERSPLAPALQALANAVPKKSAVAWAQFVATIAQLETPEIRGRTAEMLRLIVEAVYEEYAEANFPNASARLEDIEQLGNYALQFQSLDEFLTQLALLTNVEAEAENRQSEDDEKLRLSTIHQAKGLEFNVVFVIMLCDGLFPSGRSVESPDAVEEERRLFYVAVTRAKDELYLSYPMIRATAGAGGDYFQQPSRFLLELPSELVEEWNLAESENGPF
jgi:DNA helicase-2/ATP-dependent DNA helicase PcrA